MANPQCENGHIRLANEIVEALMRTQLSGYQSRVLWALWRKTYGFNKKQDWISVSQLEVMTGLRKQHISRTKAELVQRNIVTNSGNKLAFNKDYTQWRELPKMVTVTKNGYSVTKNGYTCNQKWLQQKTIYKRQYTKDSISKKILHTIGTFWNKQQIILHEKKTIGKCLPALKSNLAEIGNGDFYEDEICKAIANYAKVLKSDSFFWTYRWTLKDFLKNGLLRFVDAADPLKNFRKKDAEDEPEELLDGPIDLGGFNY